MATREFYDPGPDPSEDPLWHQIEAFDLDALDPAISFAQRVARENGWSPVYAARVIEEYKRFCYLAVKAGHAVMPPDKVDRVWRLHLGYTRDYWENFCENVLGFQLHHEPVAYDDDDETDRLRASYTETMNSYYRLSGEHPPSDIWPAAELLFADSKTMRWVNSKEYLIVRKLPRGLLWVAQTFLILATLYFLWNKQFLAGFIAGAIAGAIAVYRDGTDNEWITKPWRDGDDDGTQSGGGNMRGIS